MIAPELLAQVEDYLEWRCVDKKWFELRENLGKPVNPRKLKIIKDPVEGLKRTGDLTSKAEMHLIQRGISHIKNIHEGLIEAPMGNDPLPITDDERAKALETHRSYFANYFFALMEQKNFREEELAAKARADAAFFSRLREDRKYIPAERTVWAFLLALELNLDQANSLMHRLNYYLSANVMEEVLIVFFLDNRIYDLSLADEILAHYGFESLGIREDFSQRPDEKPFSNDSLIQRIDIYLEKNYYPPTPPPPGAKYSIGKGGRNFSDPKEWKKTFDVIVRKLKDEIGLKGNYFSDYLLKLIKQKNFTEVEVYKRAHLDRRIFSKIRNEKNYMPSKKTVLAIAFAMKLDLKEADTLLARAGYFLSDARKEDVIAAFFLDNQIYDLFLVNEVLDYYGCPILGD